MRDHQSIPPFIQKVEMRWEKVQEATGYPWSLPIFQGFDALELDPKVTFFVGENGSGKSTLLEGIAEAYGMNSEGGGRNFNFSTTEYRSPVAPMLRLVRSYRRPRTDFFLRAESTYNVLTHYEKIGRPLALSAPLHERSHGESFLDLVLHRFGEDGFYMMDEPESALSPQNQLTLLCRMAQLVKAGSQFIIATHSPILLAYPGATIIQFSEQGMIPVAYQDTDHYILTRRVLENPESFMTRLLQDA